MNFIDNPVSNDNRQYKYDKDFYFREEFPIIADWVEEGSKIIDLGCGNGALIKFILDKKNVEIEGIERSSSGVEVCRGAGFNVVVGEIDKKETYQNYSDQQFDYAICNVTLQMVMFPEVLLQEMNRISKNLIISFPNFAHISNRLDLLFKGRMPQSMLYGYKWYNTGHIHQFSLNDFKKIVAKMGLGILNSEHVGRW